MRSPTVAESCPDDMCVEPQRKDRPMAVCKIHVMETSHDGSVPPPQPGVRSAAMPQRGIAAGGPVRQAR